MTIERAIKRSLQLNNACVPSALDAALGSNEAGPHIPKWLYDEAEEEYGLGVKLAVEKVDGQVIDAVDLVAWKGCIKPKGINRKKLLQCSPLSHKLTKEDYDLASRILTLDGPFQKKKLYVALQLAVRTAFRNGLSLGISLYGSDPHFKLVELSDDGGLMIFDVYGESDEGGLSFGAAHLGIPGTSKDPDVLPFIDWVEAILYYPLTKKDSPESIIVLFNLDSESEKLERGAP